MAEIHVEKKKPVWPWVLLIIIIILALLYFFVWADNDVDDDVTEEDNIEQIEQYETRDYAENDYPQNAVGEYLSYVDRGSDDNLLGNDPRSQQKAMMLLLEAVEEKTIELNHTPGSEMESISQWDPEKQLDSIKQTGKVVVDNLQAIQRDQFPRLEDDVAELRSDLDELSVNSSEDERNLFLGGFFTKAADILRDMDSEINSTPMSPSGLDTARYSTDIDTISTNQ
ncbi:hypothetical protein RM553_13570 [Zunongwangia sp. F363]|uniref:Uncharacterized protein n=1 Tax=Autumnicola tepida TaxID=3075595 RepID=A0ABU3CBZ5_9FLAO|nr:hypothetical protein [Zunongwangia sp. F363]MDT0643862.1 hypothetical protein [Zunongwangia sp. F363]